MLAVLSVSTILHLLVEFPCYDQYFVFHLQAILHNFLRCDHRDMSNGLAFSTYMVCHVYLTDKILFAYKSSFDNFIRFVTGPNGHRC
jgi:hypothetical protein